MNDIKPFLLSLLSTSGLSGHEEPVRNLIAAQWKPLVDEISTSALGSLHGLRKAASQEKRPSLMIAAHMDAIGLMVKKIDRGLLSITHIGGVDLRTLPGQWVTVHGTREIHGVIQLIPDRLLKHAEKGKAPTCDQLFVDTGMREKELQRLVKPGDLISFAQTPMEITGGYIAGHSLDNRASIAALTVCLNEIKNYNLAWNVIAAATTQEEITFAGGYTSAFGLNPDLALVVDVTFAKGPGSSDYRCFEMGGGPTLGTGPNNHPNLLKTFSDLADDLDMPHAFEAMPRSSGTEGMAIQVTANGIPVEVLSIPIRYMHTSVEMASVNDIYRTGRLMARLITQLQPDSMQSLFAEKLP